MNKWYATNAANDSQGLIIEEGTGRSVAVAYDRKDTALLAAAPDLREALKTLLPYLEEHSQSGDRWPALCARAAIAKAEGEIDE